MKNIPRVQPERRAALLAGDSERFREEDGKVGLIVRRIKRDIRSNGSAERLIRLSDAAP
jgi:hypothetical protein